MAISRVSPFTTNQSQGTASKGGGGGGIAVLFGRAATVFPLAQNLSARTVTVNVTASQVASFKELFVGSKFPKGEDPHSPEISVDNLVEEDQIKEILSQANFLSPQESLHSVFEKVDVKKRYALFCQLVSLPRKKNLKFLWKIFLYFQKSGCFEELVLFLSQSNRLISVLAQLCEQGEAFPEGIAHNWKPFAQYECVGRISGLEKILEGRKELNNTLIEFILMGYNLGPLLDLLERVPANRCDALERGVSNLKRENRAIYLKFFQCDFNNPRFSAATLPVLEGLIGIDPVSLFSAEFLEVLLRLGPVQNHCLALLTVFEGQSLSFKRAALLHPERLFWLVGVSKWTDAIFTTDKLKELDRDSCEEMELVFQFSQFCNADFTTPVGRALFFLFSQEGDSRSIIFARLKEIWEQDQARWKDEILALYQDILKEPLKSHWTRYQSVVEVDETEAIKRVITLYELFKKQGGLDYLLGQLEKLSPLRRKKFDAAVASAVVSNLNWCDFEEFESMLRGSKSQDFYIQAIAALLHLSKNIESAKALFTCLIHFQNSPLKKVIGKLQTIDLEDRLLITEFFVYIFSFKWDNKLSYFLDNFYFWLDNTKDSDLKDLFKSHTFSPVSRSGFGRNFWEQCIYVRKQACIELIKANKLYLDVIYITLSLVKKKKDPSPACILDLFEYMSLDFFDTFRKLSTVGGTVFVGLDVQADLLVGLIDEMLIRAHNGNDNVQETIQRAIALYRKLDVRLPNSLVKTLVSSIDNCRNLCEFLDEYQGERGDCFVSWLLSSPHPDLLSLFHAAGSLATPDSCKKYAGLSQPKRDQIIAFYNAHKAQLKGEYALSQLIWVFASFSDDVLELFKELFSLETDAQLLSLPCHRKSFRFGNLRVVLQRTKNQPDSVRRHIFFDPRSTPFLKLDRKELNDRLDHLDIVTQQEGFDFEREASYLIHADAKTFDNYQSRLLRSATLNWDKLHPTK